MGRVLERSEAFSCCRSSSLPQSRCRWLVMGLPHVASRRFRRRPPTSWMPCAQLSVSRGARGCKHCGASTTSCWPRTWNACIAIETLPTRTSLGMRNCLALSLPRSSLMWAFNSAAWRRTCSTPPRSSGCRGICGCFPRSMAAFDRSMLFSRIAWRWVPNCPWMGRRISMRFGAIRSHGPGVPSWTHGRTMWSKL